MHKSKDGTVTASLTEVKNKTGDIFHLVDEFGEVVLTSYNKPRYRIVKIDSDLLDEPGEVKKTPKIPVKKEIKESTVKTTEPDLKDTEPEVVKEKAPSYNPIAAVFNTPTATEVPQTKEESKEPEVKKLFGKTININTWNRNSVPEKNFANKALKPLING